MEGEKHKKNRNEWLNEYSIRVKLDDRVHSECAHVGS